MVDLWTWTSENFNNREIAAAIWTGLFLVAAMYHRDVRESFLSFATSVLKINIISLLFLFSLNVFAVSFFLHHLGLWESDQIAATVVWYFLSGISLLVRSLDAKEETKHFKRYVIETLSVIALVEFLYSSYSFDLFVELALFPFLFFVGAMAALAKHRPEHRIARVICEYALALFVLLIIYKSLNNIYASPASFFNGKTGRNFLLPIFLTAFSTPFFYGAYCFSQLERAIRSIKFKKFSSADVEKYARKRFLREFLLRPWLLRRATRQLHIRESVERADIDLIVDQIRTYARHEKAPPLVDSALGWSPFKARKFLEKHNLKTSDYHETIEGEMWWATSPTVDLDEQLFPNTVTYYIKGDESAVRSLKLKGFFQDAYEPELASSKFLSIANDLYRAAIISPPKEITEKIYLGDNFTQITGQEEITLKYERFSSGIGYDLIFEIRKR